VNTLVSIGSSDAMLKTPCSSFNFYFCKSECGIQPTSNHINKYKKYQLLIASSSQKIAEESDMKPPSCPKGLMQT